MKKILLIIVAMAIVVAGYSVTAKAAPMNITVPLSITVAEGFGFTLDKYAYNFGTVDSGKGAETTIGIACQSNHGKLWHMALNASPFTSGSNTIASDPGFKFAGWSNDGAEKAKGTFAASGPVPATQTDLYTSTVAEGADPLVPLSLGLYVTVPAGQASGYYTTNLILTMYD